MTASIRRLIISQALFMLNFGGPIFTLFLLAKGLNLQQILTLTSVLLISSMVFEIPTGVFADKYGRKMSLVASGLVSVFCWLIWLFVDNFFGFIFVNILFGLSGALTSGTDYALIYDELKSIGREKDAQKVFSRYAGITGAVFGFAAIIGGIVTRAQTLDIFYVVYAMTLTSSILGFLVSLTIKETKISPTAQDIEHQNENSLSHFFEGVRLLIGNKKLLKITLFTTFTASIGLFDLYQVYFKQSEVPTTWYGFVLAFSSLLMSATKLYAYKLEHWFGVEKSMVISSILPAVVWILMAIFFNPVIAVILFVSNDVFGNIRDPILADYQNRHIQGKYRVTILSTISLITSGYMALMLPVIGFIADRGLPQAFIFCTTLILFGTFFFRIRADDVVAVN